MASKKLLEAVASILTDYRKGEIEPPDAAHVNRWIVQFDSKVHDPILKEVQHVLERTYLTRRNVEEFLRGISNHAELTEGKPGKFWSETSVLKIQRNGSSQKEMLQLLSEIIRNEHQVDIDASPQDGNVAVTLTILFSAAAMFAAIWLSGSPIQHPKPLRSTLLCSRIIRGDSGLPIRKFRRRPIRSARKSKCSGGVFTNWRTGEHTLTRAMCLGQ
jgi:hypothetical protein